MKRLFFSAFVFLTFSGCGGDTDEQPCETCGEIWFSSSSRQSSSSSVPNSSSSSSAIPSSSSVSLCPNYNPASSSNRGKFTDPRDNQEYSTILICNQIWLAENLNYDVDGSRCYGDNTGGDSQGNCNTYGRLYNWHTAMNNAASSDAVPSGIQGVCPPGWHLPSDDEWSTLTDYVESSQGCVSCAGKHLKASSRWAAYIEAENFDTYGFSALPGGVGYSYGDFDDVISFGYWWSATEYDASFAWFRYMDYYYSKVSRIIRDKEINLFSVRCLRD